MMNILTVSDARKMTYESIHHTTDGYQDRKTELEDIFDEIYSAANQGKSQVEHRLRGPMRTKERSALFAYLLACGYDVKAVDWEYNPSVKRTCETVIQISWKEDA